MSTIQRFLNAGNRGMAHGMQNAQALQQLFLQRDRHKQQKEQAEFEKTKARMDRFTGLAASEVPAIAEIGWQGLTALSKKEPDLFGREVDFVAIYNQNRGSDEYETWRKELGVILTDDSLDPQAKGSALKNHQAKLLSMNTVGTKEDIALINKERERNEAKVKAAQDEVKALMASKRQFANQKALATHKQNIATLGNQKTGTNWMLPDKTTVTSFDGGRTYNDATGKSVPMPYDAVKYNATVSGSEMSMIEAKKQAGKQDPSDEEGLLPIDSKTMVERAQEGTGPWASLAAAVDNVLGGVGIGKIFGKDGYFQDTQESRQVLRTVKQVGKAALMNSSRGAVWEQERIDLLFPDPKKFFVNPSTEAKKFKAVIGVLKQEKRFNNQAIQTAVDGKEVAKLRQSNIDIDRLISLIGTGESASKVTIKMTDAQKEFMKKYPPKGN